MMKKLINMFAAALAIGCGCTMIGPDLAGTSEQGNARVIAAVYTSDGVPAAGATVRLRRADYVKQLLLPKRAARSYIDLIADASGSFTIDSLDTGIYAIEVTDKTGEAVLLRFAVAAGASRTINLNTDTLRPFATIKGKVDFNARTERRFVQIKGLERLVEADVDGFYTLSDLPAGTFAVRIISNESSVDPVIIPNIVAGPGQVTLVPYNGWLFSRAVFLNTTSSGADVSADVYGFPVLVRLNAGNFTFGEAKADGSDLRIIRPDADSIPLPFEIERWDASGQLAEIWVRVDTVYGNNTSQSFAMLWGNPAAGPVTPSRPVFDTALEFGGVWHLSGQGNGQARDATSSGFHGTPVNVGSAEGMIGGAGLFVNDDKSHIVMPNTASGKLNFPADGNYSISTWVNADSLDYNRVILGKGDVQYYLRIHNSNWRFSEYRDLPEKGWEITEFPYSSGKWVHLYAVRNGTSQCLYVDGVCVDSSKTFDSNDGSRMESFNVEIGRRLLPDGSDGLYFGGAIDEVRICTVARNPEWIKLNYMNQRKDDLLVRFGN
ncbi:MAG: DUF2341 domain-containing protein [Chitinispirillaceae bacterium]|nr:DUF2341 domain-containing protein [Chitinispirillaceae bacterium]